ncbi:hypothetical protein CONLIGDRAFT_564799, partial [Coniochaeta ligniaria NRRL 30616]
CAQGSVDEGGNWFCQQVSQILYTNVGTTAGSYNEVVNMDSATGACQKTPKAIAGGLAPFDEPISLHFRGPANLIQFAVYTPGTKTKRDSIDSVVAKRHGHKHARYQHAHLHSEREAPHKVEEKREHPTIWVTATINGAVVSWTNDYWGPDDVATPAPAAPAAASTAPAAAPAPAASTPAAVVADPSPTPSSAPVTGDYVRSAYYNSNSGAASGLVFLGNYGGVAGSGAWSTTFGNSLSYLDSTGTTGASSPQVLSNVTIPSVKEFSIFSDEPCDESCGYVQPGSVAYKGFGGADKTILAEFTMPHENPNGFLADQPAFWALNAKIPRTQQYGGCSCWPECGEFDILETLANGDDKCKSTLHAGPRSGGDSNYFDRPVAKSVKVAVVFDSASNSVSVKVLDDSTVFGESLSADDIQGFLT